MTKVLVLGASGMLGNAMIRLLSSKKFDFELFGTIQSSGWLKYFPVPVQSRLIAGIDVMNDDELVAVLGRTRPDVVINCVGVIKQQETAKDPLAVLPLNSLFPHRLARRCALVGSRLIHISTDCVFQGDRGGYVEDDIPDARDLYGLSKHLGEVVDQHCVTLRTSIIGHELGSAYSLIDWFLNQRSDVQGYTNAFFSGLPTNELAAIVGSHVIGDPTLSGLYHVSAEPISKFDLLKLVGRIYGHDIMIHPNDQVVIDRSLNSDRFRQRTAYAPPVWEDLIAGMHAFSQQRVQA